MQGVQRYVVFAYLLVGLLAWATLSKLFSSLAYFANLPDYALLGNQFTFSNLLGLLVAGGAGAYAYRNERVHTFVDEVFTELRKVTWPSRKETKTATIVVIITTIIVSIILGLFDVIWGKLTGLIYT